MHYSFVERFSSYKPVRFLLPPLSEKAAGLVASGSSYKCRFLLLGFNILLRFNHMSNYDDVIA
jgi:hypothetical protein